MRPNLALAIVATMVLFMGCSGGGGSPLAPGTPGGGTTGLDGAADLPAASMPDGGHILWGYWQGNIDLATRRIEMTRLRQAEFHSNLSGLLKTTPLGLSYEVKAFNMIKGTVSVDVSLTHPYPNSNFRGFDTRGILMGPGATRSSINDPAVVYPAPNGCRLLNADGYARWWNAPEFTTSGMYGYDDTQVIPGFLIPVTTLNPYKYFADCLAADDPVVPGVNMANRGTFSTDLNPNKLTRNYKIKFPKVGGQPQFVFHYAVDVSWAPPTGTSAAPKPIDDYPMKANCQEAFHIKVDTEGTTAWYKSDDERGGDLHLAVEVFDWGATSSPGGIEGEIESIWIESDTLFDSFYDWPKLSEPGSQDTSGVFRFTIPDVVPTGPENQEVLITVRSNPLNSYAPPINGPVYPTDAVLSSYALVEIPIKSIEPDAIVIASPNGGEIWGIDSGQTVTWDWAGEVSPVNIDLSIDGGVDYSIPLAVNHPNTGQFTVASVGNYPTQQARIKVYKSSKPDVFDESDEDFTIRPYIRVDVPNGHELLMAGTSSSIKWTASTCIENIAILLSTDSGESYATAVAYSAPNTGSYIFYNIPEAYVGSHNRLKIVDKEAPYIYDESDEDFTILPKLEDQIIVGTPNGAEEWIAGTYEEIRWAGDPNIPQVNIKLSKDSGETWPVTIAGGVANADGEYNWGPIPQQHVGPNARIGVFSAINPNVYDESDEDFAITEPGIDVDTPIEGEVWEDGNDVEITWTASFVITHIDILLSLDSGATYPITIAGDTPNDGSFEWTIDDPALVETTCARVKILDHENPLLYFDDSDEFTILERSMTLTYPNGGEQWRIGFPQTIEWLWTGNIPLVDITMSLDGGATFDNIISLNAPNTGSFDIAVLDFAWLTDYSKWDTPVKAAKIKVEASGNPPLHGQSSGVFAIPITLGILSAKNAASTWGDDDHDGIKNNIESMLAMTIDNFDSDKDGMYDHNELFCTGYGSYDPVPNGDSDEYISPLDTDDNGDGTHDGELVDSDNDGVPNYLEYYGFTYNWLTGEFLKYDDEDVMEDFTVPYYKTDPMQPSTDQDPYNDGMEVSGLMMDQSVIKPGNSPMIPATPNITIRLVGYDVTLNAEISDTEGHSESQGSSWTRETSQSSSSTDESNWEVGVEVKAKFGLMSAGGGAEVTSHFNYGESHSTTSTTSSSESTSQSSSTEMNWSKTTSTNPTSAAAVKLFLKAYNTGTACASNIIPTITLKVGQHQIATFEPGNAQINLLPPGGAYPSGPDDYWVVDSIDTGTGIAPIYLTLEELRAFEVGAPISIVMAQMKADVAAMNQQGYWEYVGDWNEYIARVDAVCTHLYLDPGDGNPISYMVYADNDPSSPKVTVRDAFLWSGGYEGQNAYGDTILIDYRLPNGTWGTADLWECKWYVDYYTKEAIPGKLQTDAPDDFNFMDVELTPDSYIVGKMPPKGELKYPKIHWASYYPNQYTIYVFATDYFAVDSVVFHDTSLGIDFDMAYDDGLGCYKVVMWPGFALQSGVDNDNVKVTNIEGFSSYLKAEEIAIITEPPNPVPSVSSSKITVGETATDLTLSVYAYVTSNVHDITAVYLLQGDDTPVCQLTGPAGGGYYSFYVSPATYLPDGTEKIQVTNAGGYHAVKAVSSFGYPLAVYRSGYQCTPSSQGDHYWDIESNLHYNDRSESTDIRMNRYGSGYKKFCLQDPTNVKWRRCIDFPYPSRDFIADLDKNGKLGTSPSYFAVYLPPRDADYKLIHGDSFVFKTEQGRYAYVSILEASPTSYWTYFKVYSLYEGLGS